MIFFARLLMNRRARRTALSLARNRGRIGRGALVAGAAVAALAGFALLRRLRSQKQDDPQRDTIAVAGSRKPGRAASPDSEDPLERIESQVISHENNG